MQIGFIGLGRMGANMVLRLLEKKHRVVGYNRDPAPTRELARKGMAPASSVAELVGRLDAPRAVWLMVPHQAVDAVLKELVPLLRKGDIVIDGGNSYWKDSKRRAAELATQGIAFLDVGTSGGVAGAREGACMMIGGDKGPFRKLERLFRDMTVKDGYAHCGPPGAGHYVKMVHNGIEYGLMEAYAEGFDLLKNSCDYPRLDMRGVAHVWSHGSIIQSFLLERIAHALAKNPQLKDIIGYVEDSGEGRWTVQAAIECGVDVPVLAHSLFVRFRSREKNPFSDRLLVAMRHEFGGHAVKRKK